VKLSRVNDGYIHRERIDGRGAGLRVERYLSERYTHSSHAQWCEHIRAGRVLLDGAAAGEGALLVSGQELEWHRPPWREPSAPLSLPVLYDHGGVLVVAKPAGLPTMPGGGFLQNTLLHQLRLLDPGASPVHRLGRWTSGVVLCSRTPAVGASLAAQFAGRTIHKRYRALASGRPASDSFQIDVPIGPVAYPPLGTLHASRPDGRPSSSRVTVIERREDSFLCDVTIATGRPHQIRIHLAAAGHPLVGDPLYVAGGHPSPNGTALPGDPGYQLLAAEIGFDHPETGERVTVAAPLPEVLRRSRA
jgi:23S rRNA pseudouridine1911/1915/1917 synthase